VAPPDAARDAVSGGVTDYMEVKSWDGISILLLLKNTAVISARRRMTNWIFCGVEIPPIRKPRIA